MEQWEDEIELDREEEYGLIGTKDETFEFNMKNALEALWCLD